MDKNTRSNDFFILEKYQKPRQVESYDLRLFKSLLDRGQHIHPNQTGIFEIGKAGDQNDHKHGHQNHFSRGRKRVNQKKNHYQFSYN